MGACTFGIPHDDRVDLAPNVPGWERLAFGTRLRLAFPGAQVRVATDVKAAARAELDNGALTGCDVGLYVNLGTWTDRCIDASSPPDRSLPALRLDDSSGRLRVSLFDLAAEGRELQRFESA